MRHVCRRIVERIRRLHSNARANTLGCRRRTRFRRRLFGSIAASSCERNKQEREANRTKRSEVHKYLLPASCYPLSIAGGDGLTRHRNVTANIVLTEACHRQRGFCKAS